MTQSLIFMIIKKFRRIRLKPLHLCMTQTLLYYVPLYFRFGIRINRIKGRFSHMPFLPPVVALNLAVKVRYFAFNAQCHTFSYLYIFHV